MLKYRRQPGDSQYRIVSLKEGTEQNYQDFQSEDDVIPYNEYCVVEIRRADESERLIYDGKKQTFRYSRNGNLIRIPKAIPLHRLWMCTSSAEGVWYKIPYNLPENGIYHEFLLESNLPKLRLSGDKYFRMVYNVD